MNWRLEPYSARLRPTNQTAFPDWIACVDTFLASIVSIAFHGVAYGMVLYVISVGL